MEHTPKSWSGENRINSHDGGLIVGPSLWFRAKTMLFLAARSNADQAEEFVDENKKIGSNVPNISEARECNILRNRVRGKAV